MNVKQYKQHHIAVGFGSRYGLLSGNRSYLIKGGKDLPAVGEEVVFWEDDRKRPKYDKKIASFILYAVDPIYFTKDLPAEIGGEKVLQAVSAYMSDVRKYTGNPDDISMIISLCQDSEFVKWAERKYGEESLLRDDYYLLKW